MEPETKQAFSIILEAILKDKDLYDAYPRTWSRDADKFTAMGLGDLACGRLFDGHSQSFGITERQGHIIHEYFHDPNYSFINELYREFPNVFEGESRKYAESGGYIEFIDKDIPLF